MFKGIGIIPNWEKTNTNEVVEEITTFFSRYNVPVYVEPSKDPLLNLPSPIKELQEWSYKVDLVIVVGGDGSFLRAARELAGLEIPILGINLGHKGFLAETEIDMLPYSLEKLVQGKYYLSERMMLFTEVFRNEEFIASYITLNDVIISRGPFSRIINLDTYINEDFLETYPGDGVIIASPTGSTGYSLSAGGPVINPSLKVLVVTPICPHLLYQRSVVVDKDDTISILVASETTEDIFLTLDGQEGFQLHYKDRIKVRRADASTRVINFPEYNFYKLLHNKLI